MFNVTIAQLCRDTSTPDYGNHSVLPACDCPGFDNNTVVVNETCQFASKVDHLSLWQYLVILNFLNSNFLLGCAPFEREKRNIIEYFLTLDI